MLLLYLDVFVIVVDLVVNTVTIIDCILKVISDSDFFLDIPFQMIRKEVETWLEKVGKLEAITVRGFRRKHLVIWENDHHSKSAIA